MGKDKYICPCFKVTKKDVKEAIKNGADTFKAAKKATRLGEGCGHCCSKARNYVKKRLK